MKKRVSQFQSEFFASLADGNSMRRLFDFLPDAYLYVKDAEGRFVAMNDALVRLRGAQHPDELIGKTDIELHPVDWGNLYREEDLRVIRSGEELTDQVWLVPVDGGHLRTFVSSKIPLRDRQGEVVGIAGVMYALDDDSPSKSESASHPIEIVVERITSDFAEPMTIKSLAVTGGLSVSQLNRRFRAKYRMSPSEYLQRVRVHQACRLLADGDDSVASIALDTGFYDQAHLTRTFKKWRGMTPSEFRKATRDENTL